MERKRRRNQWLPVLIPAAILAAGAASLLLLHFLRARRLNTQIGQQNYVASRLLEIGEYEQGRVLAAQTDQIQENQISRQLLVLAAGFQADYGSGIRYADGYLEEEADPVISEAKEAMADYLSGEEKLDDRDNEAYLQACVQLKEKVRESMMALLLRVQNSIDVKTDSDSILAMLDMMTRQGGGLTEDETARLEKDDSNLGRRTRAAYAIQTGDYAAAFEITEKAFRDNPSFENRAMLANLAAEGGDRIGREQDGQESSAQEKRQRLQEQIYELEAQYQQTQSASEQSRLTRRMEELQADLQDCEDAIRVEPVRRAINFIETTTPVTERDTVACRLELAQLYYRAGNRDRAKELLADVIRKQGESSEPAALLLDDFIAFYQIVNGRTERPAYMDDEMSIGVFWERIAGLLNFIESWNYYGETESFYGYVLNVLDELFNGVIIRRIDASGFPEVKVSVNVAMELEKSLTKDDFTVTEMNVPLKQFELTAVSEREMTDDLAVELVVDRSGSMSGTPMEDTKKAVSNFVKSADDGVRMGLVSFDDAAYVDAKITESRSQLLNAVRSITDGGGTSIWSGLEQAGKELENESGRRIIILLSDGEDGDTSRIDAVLEELNRKDIYVYAIGFGGADTEYLSSIASRCQGKFIQADSSGMLGEIYAAIGEYMVNDYIIQFNVETEPDQFTRTVYVSIDVNDAFAEKEYYVGVPLSDILEEDQMEPLADYFVQVGGSQTNGQEGGE